MPKLKVFSWYDLLVVAEDESDVRRLIREKTGMAAAEIRQYGAVKRVRRSQELTTDGGDTFNSYSPTEIAGFGRGVLPSID